MRLFFKLRAGYKETFKEIFCQNNVGQFVYSYQHVEAAKYPMVYMKLYSNQGKFICNTDYFINTFTFNPFMPNGLCYDAIVISVPGIQLIFESFSEI